MVDTSLGLVLVEVDGRDREDQVLDALRIERGVAEREDAAFADPQEADGREFVLAADELDAVVEVAVDVVFEGQPAVASRRTAPVHGVHVDPEREEVAQHRAILLQVGHGVAADLPVGHQHRRAQGALRDRLVAIERRLVLPEHHLLVGGGDLHVFVLDALQHLLPARHLEVEVAELGEGLGGDGFLGHGFLRRWRNGGWSGAGMTPRPRGWAARRSGFAAARQRRRRTVPQRRRTVARRAAAAAPAPGASVRSPCAASRPSRCASGCDRSHTRLRRSCAPAGGTPTAARNMRRCASTNSSDRCTSIRVSLTTSSQRSVRPRQVAGLSSLARAKEAENRWKARFQAFCTTAW